MVEASDAKPLFTTLHGHRTKRGDGKLESPTYTTWRAMLQRVYNKNHPSHAAYAEAGVIVVPEWHTFANFLADVGERPPGKTLGRNTPFSNYGPGEVSWQTAAEQSKSIRRVCYRQHKITVDGKTKTKMAWAKWLGISYRALLVRINRGWGEDAYRIRAGQRRSA